MSAHAPSHAAVWFEIPVSDLARAQAFYGAVLQSEPRLDEKGPNPIAVFVASDADAVAGHAYPGRPAAPGTGPTIHLAAPEPLEEAIARVAPHGGQVVSPIISIPAGRFAYCLDPDGNSFGLFGA